MQITCAHCGKAAEKPAGAVNRARKCGLSLYCDRTCAGLGRRKPSKSIEQKKAEKKAYDAARRIALADKIRAAKREYHKRTYDVVKAAEERKRRMQRHVEYCRRPEYVAWKREYDRLYRANKEYGEFAECFLLVMDIRAECLSQMTDYEIRYAKGGVAKTQQRRRAYGRLNREDFEDGSLGDVEFCEGREDGCVTSRLRGLPSAGNLADYQYPASGGAPVEAPGGRGRNQLR